ncbi:MAG: Wzz/FepE/Etk N-terminal domain-containing protein [Magnetococcus sp. WYHC-3]
MWQIVWQQKALILICIGLFSAVAVYMAVTMTPIYRATVVMEPRTEDGNTGTSLTGRYGGLAAMAGFNLGGQSSVISAIVKLQSREFLSKFIEDENLMPVLFEEQWDPVNKRWVVEDPKFAPTLWNGVDLFRKEIQQVVQEVKSGIITMTIDWSDPELASRWANLMVKRINQKMRADAIESSQKNLDYLTNQLNSTSIADLRATISGLMETEIKRIMLAHGKEEFSFKVLDPAQVPPWYAVERPKKKLIAIGGFMIGGMVGLMLAFFRNFLIRNATRAGRVSASGNG